MNTIYRFQLRASPHSSGLKIMSCKKRDRFLVLLLLHFPCIHLPHDNFYRPTLRVVANVLLLLSKACKR